MRSPLFLFLALSLSAAVACGGSEPPAKPPTTDMPADAAPPNAAADPPDAGAAAAATPAVATPEPAKEPKFADLPGDKKLEVMMTKVGPNMGKVFKEHDGKKFAKFGCATCHGPAKKKDHPNKFLPKLTFANGGFEKLAKAKPAMVKFMSEKVVPAMADSIGEKPMDPKTKQGFGCNGCHTVD